MDYLQTVVDYVEGRVAFEQFYALILEDDGFANWINQHAPSVWRCTERPSEANGHQFTFVPYEVRSKLKNMEWAYPVDSIDYQYELESAMEVLLEDSFPEVVFHADPTSCSTSSSAHVLPTSTARRCGRAAFWIAS